MRILNMRDKVTTFSITYQIAYYSFRFIIYSICFYDRKALQTYFFCTRFALSLYKIGGTRQNIQVNLVFCTRFALSLQKISITNFMYL